VRLVENKEVLSVEDLIVGVRHGTQFGTAASTVLEKIEKQRFLGFARLLQALIEIVSLLNIRHGNPPFPLRGLSFFLHGTAAAHAPGPPCGPNPTSGPAAEGRRASC